MEKLEYLVEEKELNKLIEKLQSLIKTDCIILLRGDLASGKTTLVRNYVKSIGLNESVTSPTFSLQTVYGENIYHYDVYNKTLEEFISLGMLEEFEKSGVHFVEWGNDELEELLSSYGFSIININIEKYEDKRRYKIYA